MKIEICSSSIQESFGKPEYYKKLSYENKIIKLAVIDYLAKMVKYGEIRANDQPNFHNLKSPTRYYYLKHPIIIDNKKYEVNMDIRKVPGCNGRFYIYSVTTKKTRTRGNRIGRQLNALVNANNISQTSYKSKLSDIFNNSNMQYNIINTQVIYDDENDIDCYYVNESSNNYFYYDINRNNYVYQV